MSLEELSIFSDFFFYLKQLNLVLMDQNKQDVNFVEEIKSYFVDKYFVEEIK